MEDKVNKLGNLAKYIYDKKKISFFNNEKYILEKIKKNWEIFVGGPIFERSEPKSLFQKILTVNLTDATVYHTFLLHKNVVKDRINKFLGEDVVRNIEIHKVNYKIKREILDELIENEENFGTLKVGEMLREHEVTKRRWGNNKKKVFTKKFTKKGKIDINKVILPKEIIDKIHKAMTENPNCNKKLSERLESILIKMEKRRICLKELGYVECKMCKSLFKPMKDEKICFECEMAKKNKIFESMMRLIQEKPFIGERQALKIIKTDKKTYYKAREVLAQQIYNELLYFCIEKNKEIGNNEEYSFEIRNEAKKEMEDMIKNYIDCKIGSDNKEVFKIERKRILSKLKKDVEFRMKYRYR